MLPNKKWQRLLFASLFMLFAFSAFALCWNHIQRLREKNALEQLAQAKQSIEAAGESQTPQPTVLEQYDALRRQNGDMIGWIAIDGTEINYPVMYTGDDFYLTHGFERENSRSGVPYIDKRCAVDPFGTNTIIYGHNMKNTTMFSGLLLYKSAEYYAQHPIIRFDTLYDAQEYEIVAAFESEVYHKSDTVFKHYNFLTADNQADFEDYIAGIMALSLYDTGVRPEYGDWLITLMTCSYHTENGRFVVVARKIDSTP